MPEKLYISKDGEFCDAQGNIKILRGVNLDPNVKIPASPFLTTHGVIKDKRFWDEADNVSFINHPLPLDQVETHINRVKSLGYNNIRFPFTWESIEHEGPGIYDHDYMDYVIDLLKIINRIDGIYVYLDPHQDVWSRFTGGSGAPHWTLLCAGFQPSRFKHNEASIVHNNFINPKTGKDNHQKYPKMVWATNYYKLACQTMFTLFFGGKYFAPKCIINNMNIQDYLQEKHMDAILTFYARMQEKAPELFENNCIIGLESMNEPSHGYIGTMDLGEIEKDRQLRIGSTPTAFQSFMLGEGKNTTIDEYEISIFGPSKSGTKNVNCKGESAWLSKKERDTIDAKYGWVRDKNWVPETCIWKIHGVWKTTTAGSTLVKPDYFSKIEETGTKIDETYFINNFFPEYFNKLHEKFRKIDSESFILLQPPVFKEPPHLSNLNIISDKTICACHFYDGLSLMFKTWNKFFNVDTFGVVRGNYSNPVFSVVLGESSIRKSFRNQLKLMKEEVKGILGKNVPVFFTEIGMPFDMDNKKAYKFGDYISQTKAMDAISYALEGNNLSFSLWCYCSNNSHKWGDNWNNEDFSIFSSEDSKESTPVPIKSLSSKSRSPSPSFRSSSNTPDFITMSNFDDILSPPTPTLEALDFSGLRALDALLRPFPIKIHGKFRYAEFNLEDKFYKLKIHAKASSNSQSTKRATYIFLPSYHFLINKISINASSGTFIYNEEYQILKWHHDAGNQFIIISSKLRSFSNDNGCIIS